MILKHPILEKEKIKLQLLLLHSWKFEQQSGQKKVYESRGKTLRSSNIFFDGVFLSIYSHLLKKLELSKRCRKKVMGL